MVVINFNNVVLSSNSASDDFCITCVELLNLVFRHFYDEKRQKY
jgi:hypothetical protein